MHKNALRILVLVTALFFSVLLVGLLNHFRNYKPSVPHNTIQSSNDVTPDPSSGPNSPYDSLLDDERLESNGYLVTRKSRRIYDRNLPPNFRWSNVEQVVVQRSGRIIHVFGAGIIGMGQSARFGFYSFLNQRSPQLFISEEVSRGGRQWVATLSPKFRVIFDGEKFGVGREGADLQVEDLDHDGNYEIILPLTDFYSFQDKMSVSQIPLPSIVFKYDPRREEYVPSNSQFKEFLKTNSVEALDDSLVTDQMAYRSDALSKLTTLIYCGEMQKGWQIFERDYKLPDKAEMEVRIKRVLRQQPVYKFLYSSNLHQS